MKKALKWIAGGFILAIVAAILLSGFSVYDYGSKCTRCLREYHVVEKKYFGFTYAKTETLEFAGYDFPEITGSPCQHIYRTTGFGREEFPPFGGGMEGDGGTAEGNLFRGRWQALDKAFKLYQSTHNQALMRRTLAFADACMPPDATTAFINNPKNRGGYLMMLAFSLDKARGDQDWKAALDEVEATVTTEK